MTESSWLNRIRRTLTGHQLPAGVTLLHTLEGISSGSAYFISWSPDGKLACGDDTVHLWDPATGILLRTFEDQYPAVWSPDGKLLASSAVLPTNTDDYDPVTGLLRTWVHIHLWDPATGILLRTLKAYTAREETPCLAWSPDGRLLASSSDDSKKIQLWNPTTGTLLRTLECQQPLGGVWPPHHLAWSPDSKRLASCTHDCIVHLWDPTTGILLHTLKYPRLEQGVRDRREGVLLAWSPDSRLLASGSSQGRVYLWDPATGALLHTLKGHQDSSWVASLVWSPDSKQLASSAINRTSGSDKVHLWDPATGALLDTPEHKGTIGFMDWSPDSKLLAAIRWGNGDGEVYIWRTDTWESLAVLIGLWGIYPVAWHPYLPLLVTPGMRKAELCAWHLDLARLLRAVPSSERIAGTDAKIVPIDTSSASKQIGASRDRENAAAILQRKIIAQDFDVFLCHNRQDKPAVKQIGEQLKLSGILPWLDEWELRPGLPWQQLLEEQIAQIKTAAVFVGKNGWGPWHRQELNAFLREFVRRGCPVIPVLLPDAPQEPPLPEFLKAMTWVDFRIQDPDPMQRLLWGITGKQEWRS